MHADHIVFLGSALSPATVDCEPYQRTNIHQRSHAPFQSGSLAWFRRISRPVRLGKRILSLNIGYTWKGLGRDLGLYLLIISSSSPHHLLIISSLSPHHLLIISSLSPHHLLIISSSSPHYLLIISSYFNEEISDYVPIMYRQVSNKYLPSSLCLFYGAISLAD